MQLKKWDRVKLLIRTWEKDDNGEYIVIEEYGTIAGFNISDKWPGSTVGIIKDRYSGVGAFDYCFDTGYQFVWGQGIYNVSDWERIDPMYLPIEPVETIEETYLLEVPKISWLNKIKSWLFG